MPRPTSPHRASRQHLERTGVQRLTIRRTVLTAIDAPSNRVELVRIGQRVQAPARPEPSRRHTRVLRLLQQFRMIDQVEAQRFAARLVIGPASDLDQATAAILGAVPHHGIAQVCPALVFDLGFGWAPDLFSFELVGGDMLGR